MTHANLRPALDGAQAWRVDTQPVVTIGAGASRAMDADTLYEFTDVVGAHLLDDSRIVIAVMGSSSLRFYDSTGNFLSSAGRKGEGPGEFRQILGLYRTRGDTLAVNDYYVELDWFDPQGRTIANPGARRRDKARLQVVAVLDDGTSYGIELNDHVPEGRFLRRRLKLLRVSGADGEVDSVAVVPGILEIPRVPGQPVEMIIFTPGMLIASLGDSLVTANSSNYEIEVRGADGAIGRTFGRPVERVIPDQRLKDAYRAFIRDRRLENGQRFSERFLKGRMAWLDRDPYADTLPAIRAVFASRDGEIWVARYTPAVEFRRNWTLSVQYYDEPTIWDVFDRSGRWLTTVELPPRFSLIDVRGTAVLGLVANDDEEEGVRVLRLIRPTPPDA